MTLQPLDRLEALLTEHLSSELGPQRGKALAAFRRQLAMESKSDAVGEAAGRVIPRRALWYWAGVPSALAACLAVAVTLQIVGRQTVAPVGGTENTRGGNVAPGSPDPVAVNSDVKPLEFEKLDQYQLSREMNDGVAVLNDNTPVRVIRQQTLKHTEWVDPTDKARYSVTEPGEKVGYIRVQPN